jgi:hypothetical protein
METLIAATVAIIRTTHKHITAKIMVRFCRAAGMFIGQALNVVSQRPGSLARAVERLDLLDRIRVLHSEECTVPLADRYTMTK